MKRHIRCCAVAAPALGLIAWIAMAQHLTISSMGTERRTGSSQSNQDIGRTRDLPASGPVAAPDGPTEMIMTFDHARTMMPHLNPMIEQHAR